MPILLFLHSVGSVVLNMLASRVGQVALAFVVAWAWSAHRTNAKWEVQIAAERAAYLAAYQAEVARQERAATEIAREATKRLADEQAAAADMQQQIAELEKAETHAPTIKGKPPVACRIDDDFARRLRGIDAGAGARKAPRRPGALR